MNKPLLTIISVVYNSRKYIEACANSVLHQTLGDIQWIVLDNGCTDGTGEILAQYAAQDSRMMLVRNEKNYALFPDAPHTISYWPELIRYCDSEYFAMLDSDDTYDLTFAQKMYQFAKAHDADIAACGTTMFREEKPKERWNRIPTLFTEPDPAKMGEHFSDFYGSFRPVWGKLFRKMTYQEHHSFLDDKPSYLVNGVDTFFCLRFMQVAKRIVCLDESLHQYLIRKESAYNANLYAERWRCYDLLYHEGIALLEKWNQLTPENQSFLCFVHFHSVLDCIDVVDRSGSASKNERMAFLKDMLGSDVIKLYLSRMDASGKETLFQKTCSSVNTIFEQNKGQLFLWCCWLHDSLPVLVGASIHIKRALASSPLLKHLNTDQAIYLQSAIAAVLQNDFAAAIDSLLLLADSREIPDAYAEGYILLGQNVCALAEYADGWVFFKKLWVEYLLEHFLVNEARAELDEFERLLPGDEDFAELRKKL